jgi:SAM-dependent methyltransferase
LISPRDAYFLTEAVGAASAIAAGGDLGVFQAPAVAPLTATELATRCGLAEGAAERLVSALAGIGVLHREGGGYRLAVDRGLVESQSELWGRLPDVVRRGSSTGFDEASTAAGEYPSVVAFLRELGRAAARRAAVPLADGLPAGGQVLKAPGGGAGAAAWSLALVARQPSCQVTAFDLSPVLEVTRRSVEDAGRLDRYRCLAGDAFHDELGGPYDLALVPNVLHLFGEARAVELLTRVAAMLRPGGRLAVIHVMPDPRGPSRRAALHDLSLLLRTRDGALHPYGSYTKWLGQAGLEPIARHRLDPDCEAILVLASSASARDGESTTVPEGVMVRTPGRGGCPAPRGAATRR